jgi:DNA-directed RNA polymerase beta subunit
VKHPIFTSDINKESDLYQFMIKALLVNESNDAKIANITKHLDSKKTFADLSSTELKTIIDDAFNMVFKTPEHLKAISDIATIGNQRFDIAQEDVNAKFELSRGECEKVIELMMKSRTKSCSEYEKSIHDILKRDWTNATKCDQLVVSLFNYH